MRDPAMRLPAFLLLALAMDGCVSVPLSTMVRMSTFDEQDFARLDADVVRVRIKLPQEFALDAGRSSLGVKVTAAAGVHYGDFKLEQEGAQGTTLSNGMFSGSAPGTAYTLKLSAPSRSEFRKLQAFVGRGQPGEVVISVVPILSSFPRDAATVNVWIDLLLTESQGYFTLLEGAEVPMEAIRAASARS